jgi:para-nitrobenzyl esterase
MAMSIIDGRFLPEPAETAVEAGQIAQVAVMIGANDRDLGIGSAQSKDELFARFGSDSSEARRLYDPRGDPTLDELKQQAFADRTMTEPVRHFAKLVAHSGQPVWLYRFAYVTESQRGKLMGTLHGFEIPFTLNIPAALVGDKVTATDKIMGDLASAYWAQFAKTGDPTLGPMCPRYDPAVDRLIHFTNSGIIVGTDPLKLRLDLWERVEPGAVIVRTSVLCRWSLGADS